LEGDAEIEAEGFERFFLHLGAAGNHGAEPGGGGEQRCRLGGDDFQVSRFRGGGVVGRGELHDLALGDHGGGVGEDAQHLQGTVAHHHLEGARKQEVTDQDARLVAPDRVGGGASAPEIRFIDHVVVKQRGGVDEFHRARQSDLAVASIAAQLGRAQQQHGPQPLAAGGNDVARQLRDQRDRAVHFPEDQRIDPCQVVCHQVLEGVQRRARFAAAFVIEFDDDSQDIPPF
jgi:hypothetical protein